jgi:hypothetical protein
MSPADEMTSTRFADRIVLLRANRPIYVTPVEGVGKLDLSRSARR